jgi:hypothetical protein
MFEGPSSWLRFGEVSSLYFVGFFALAQQIKKLHFLGGFFHV